ncbi:MAG: YhfC family intramembrane metalloprotease, partial [Anaerolineales bacterium]
MLLVLQILSPLMMLAIPLTLGAWVVRRWKLDWAIFGLGGLTFVASQLFHIPFNRIVLNPWVERQGWLGAEGWPWVMLALVFGLS